MSETIPAYTAAPLPPTDPRYGLDRVAGHVAAGATGYTDSGDVTRVVDRASGGVLTTTRVQHDARPPVPDLDLAAIEARLQAVMNAIYNFGWVIAASTERSLNLGPIMQEYRALIDAHDAAVSDVPALCTAVRWWHAQAETAIRAMEACATERDAARAELTRVRAQLARQTETLHAERRATALRK